MEPAPLTTLSRGAIEAIHLDDRPLSQVHLCMGRVVSLVMRLPRIERWLRNANRI
jgi:hypothetical protein